MEKFFYFGILSASNLSIAYPVESWRGAHPEDDTTLHLYFTPLHEMGLYPDKDNDVMSLTISTNKHKEVLQAIAEAMNTSEEHVIVVIDIDTSEKVSSDISAVAAIMSSDV